jgi:hypothetical protein
MRAKRKVLAIVVPLCGMMGAWLVPLGGTARAEGFNITNTIAPGVAYVSPPTNSIGTNGVGYSTGGAIRVDNYERIGFWFSCQGTSSTNQTITVNLVRAPTAGPPSATDWETASVSALTITTSGTNPVVWCTNLDSYFTGPGNWLGIASITNSGNASVTNCAASVVKKIIPIRYP